MKWDSKRDEEEERWKRVEKKQEEGSGKVIENGRGNERKEGKGGISNCREYKRTGPTKNCRREKKDKKRG